MRSDIVRPYFVFLLALGLFAAILAVGLRQATKRSLGAPSRSTVLNLEPRHYLP